MRIKSIILSSIVILTCTLTGCTDEIGQSVEKSLAITKPEITITPLTDTMPQSKVDIILIETINIQGEINREQIKFSEHGIIKGDTKIMVPVTNYSLGGIYDLGVSVDLSLNGKFCRLTKNQIYLDFDMESLTCFKNEEPVALLDDIPFYNNGTLYIPFESMLDGFEIPYKIEENMLIISDKGEI